MRYRAREEVRQIVREELRADRAQGRQFRELGRMYGVPESNLEAFSRDVGEVTIYRIEDALIQIVNLAVAYGGRVGKKEAK